MKRERLSDKIGAFTAVPNRFIEQSATFSDAALRLFICLRYHTNQRTDDAFPGYDAIRELEAAGWLERRKRFGQSTIYTITFPPEQVASSTPVCTTDESASSTPVCTVSSTPVCTTVVHPYVLEQDSSNKTQVNKSIGADAPTLALEPTPTPDNLPDTQPSKKKRAAIRKEDTSPVVSTSSPAPLPLDFQQRAARAALDERAPVAWDDLPSASSAPSLPLPPGSVGDLDAALEWVCYGTTGDRETWALYGGQIRKARKDIREANKTLRIQITGQEIRERFAWPDGDWYATYMAKDEAGGFTRKPTPASVVKHIRALDNARVAQERTLPRAYTPAPGGGWGKAAPAPAPEPALVFTPEQLQERQERARRAYQAALDAARQREPGA